jgi:hypothetical protein
MEVLMNFSFNSMCILFALQRILVYNIIAIGQLKLNVTMWNRRGIELVIASHLHQGFEQ